MLTVEKPVLLGNGAARKPDPIATTPDAPTSIRSTAPSGRRVAAYVVGGVGLAALGLGGVMGGLTLAKKNVISEHCGAGIGQQAEEACDSTGFDAANNAKPIALGSTIGFGVGVVGVGVAVALLLTEPASKPKQGTVLSRNMTAFLDVGPNGAQVGVRGTL